MTHYCDACDAGLDPDDDRHVGECDGCCGGDDYCDAIEPEPDCGSGMQHRWTSSGTGGCDSNPGVWSLGGTTYQSDYRCVLCGTRRREISHGSQRNPGECDSVSYSEDGYDVDPDEARDERRRQRRNARARARRRAAKAVRHG